MNSWMQRDEKHINAETKKNIEYIWNGSGLKWNTNRKKKCLGAWERDTKYNIKIRRWYSL